VLRFPIVFVILTAMVGFFYWAAPAEAVPFKWTSLGAAMFGIVWLIATWIFVLYIANFGQYSNTYGFLAGVAILLLWLYLTNMVLLAGAEANAIMDQRIDVTGDGRTEREHSMSSA
jgi:membrane protein